MQLTSSFLSPHQHFDKLISQLDEDTQLKFKKLKNIRLETAYEGRQFILYSMSNNGNPVELERFRVKEFYTDFDVGAETEIMGSHHPIEPIMVSYSPVQLFDYPVFVWLPLHMQVKMDITPEGKRSLAFPLCIKVGSRKGMRQPRVYHFETGHSFGKEFNSNE